MKFPGRITTLVLPIIIASCASHSGFDKWSPEKQCNYSSVILKLTYETDSSGTKCILREIIKPTQPNATTFKLGTDLTRLSIYSQTKDKSGEGELLFFNGNPPSMFFASTYDSRPGAPGDATYLFRLRTAAQVDHPH